MIFYEMEKWTFQRVAKVEVSGKNHFLLSVSTFSNKPLRRYVKLNMGEAFSHSYFIFSSFSLSFIASRVICSFLAV